MSAVVQATCPGCKQVLRIPSDWLNQPFRCKHCRTIIQAQSRPQAAPQRPSPSSQTPVPPTRPVKPPARKTPTVPVAVGVIPPPPPAPAPAPAAIPVAGMSAYVAPAALPVAAAPPAAIPLAAPAALPVNKFAGIDEAAPGLKPRRPRRSWWPMLIGLILLGGSAGATVHFWPEIAPLFENHDKGQANKDDNKPAPPPDEGNKDKDGGTKTTDKDKAPPVDPNKDKRPDPNKDKKTTSDPNKDKKPPVDPNKDKKPPVDPNKDKTPIPDPNKDKKPPPDPNKDRTKKPFDGAFPRRALVVSVNNYLFANPVTAGDNAPNGRNLPNFMAQLSSTRSWRISPGQTLLLSDAGRPPRFQANSPIKATIENTITEFLKTSRAQDRVVLLFIGHAVEIEDKAYLAPIESDLTTVASMIPLDWVYKQLEACPAKQKLLILDVCRFNPSKGEERPGSGPMGAKFDLALKNPPAGIQVWSSCTEGQRSYEIEDGVMFNNSVFMDALHSISVNGVDLKAVKPEDDIPLETMVSRVNGHMKNILGPRKFEQTSRLSGAMKEGGPAFDPMEKPAPEPVVMAPAKKNVADASLVRGILKELNVPPIKKQQEEGLLRYESMPPFAAEMLDKYPNDNTPSKLRDAVERAQAVLWAVSAQPSPAELAAAVAKIKETGELKADLGTLQESYRAPAGGANQENAFKDRVFNDTRRVASILRILEEELKNLEDAGKMKAEAPKRWQANYDFILARLMSQIAYVYEYSSMLGAMRKEFPQRDPAVHSGWRLASRKKMQGDGTGRKLARDAEKILEKLAADYAGTPWEILAKREKFTALGLEWKPQ